MIITLAMGLAIIIAVVVVGGRRWQRRSERRRQPGATLHRAVVVNGFDEIDAAIQGRTCQCEERLVESGETSKVIGDRRLRIVRLVCPDCEREELMYFDVTAVFH